MTYDVGRNALCPCGSGRKFKKCHLNRKDDSPLPIAEVIDAEREAHPKTCLHPGNADGSCAGAIVRAHTVQRALLEQIAVEGHVYGVKTGVGAALNREGPLKPERIGLNKASTFTGFCGYHDKKTFSPIEDAHIECTREHALLLGYRAVCKELYAKRSQISMTEVLRQADRGTPEPVQRALQDVVGTYALGAENGLRDLDAHKSRYDKAVLSGDVSEVNALFVEFAGLMPIMVSGAIFPECSFAGKALQDLSLPDPVDLLAFSLLPSRGKSVAVFVWVGPSDACRELVDSLLALPSAQVPHALTRFVYEFFENTFVGPTWWDGLPIGKRRALMRRIESGANPLDGRRVDCLRDDALRVVDVSVERVVDLRAPARISADS